MAMESPEQKKILAKLHRDPSGEKVLALIDSDLIGKPLIHPQTKKKIIPSKKFYGGKEVDVDTALKLLFSYQNVNAFGSVIEFAIQKGRLDPDVPIWFELVSSPRKKIPHLLVLDVSESKGHPRSNLFAF